MRFLIIFCIIMTSCYAGKPKRNIIDYIMPNNQQNNPDNNGTSFNGSESSSSNYFNNIGDDLSTPLITGTVVGTYNGSEMPAIHDDLEDIINALLSKNITISINSTDDTATEELVNSVTPVTVNASVATTTEENSEAGKRDLSSSLLNNGDNSTIVTFGLSSKDDATLPPVNTISTKSTVKPEIENSEKDGGIDSTTYNPFFSDSWDVFNETKSTTTSQTSSTSFSMSFDNDDFFKNETKKSDDEDESDISFVKSSEDSKDSVSTTITDNHSTESMQSTTSASVDPTPMSAAIVTPKTGSSSHLTSSLYSLVFVLIIFCAI